MDPSPPHRPPNPTFVNRGEMGGRIRVFDWSATPLGPAERWPPSLAAAVGICLNSPLPMFVWWGPSLINIYNDAYIPVLGARHPHALGRPARETWADIWPVIGEDVDRVVQRGEAVFHRRVRFQMERNGFTEETFFTYSHSPIPDGDGGIGGLFQVCQDETQTVLTERERDREAEQRRRADESLRQSEGRFRFLSELSERTRDLADPERVMATVARTLGEHLRASRCAYADVEADSDRFTIRHDYTDGCASTTGDYHLTQFGPRAAADQRAGRTLVVHDVDAELAPAEGADVFNAIGIKAVICCPLVREGRLVAMMAVHQTTPRRWRGSEVELVEAVVERSWAYIERARAGRSLAESEAFHRFATEAGRIGTWFLRLDTQECTLAPIMAELMGFPPGQRTLSASQWRDRVVPEDRAALDAAIAATMTRGTPIDVEFRIVTPAGQRRWISSRGGVVGDHAGKPHRVHGASVDVTERRLAAEREREAAAEAIAAAEANAKFRTFFEQGAYFAGVLSLDGTVIEANRVCLDACGFTREEVVGRKFWECGWWDRSPELMAMVRDASARAARGEVVRRETPYFVADGSQRFVDLAIGPVTDAQGRVLFVAPTGADITERKRMEDERNVLLDAERHARTVAERASRLKDEFLATLSHELRTPLNAILGWSEMLSRTEGDAARTRQGLEVIARNARSQAQIIEDLLDMSRIISGKIRLDVEPVTLPAVIEAAMDTVRTAAEAKGVALQAMLDPQAGPVSGDKNRLQQVFWNLLSNAIKFTPKGGRVRVVLERVNSHLEASVIDSGEGIATDFLPYVFDRFRQADASTTRQHGGLGLGLAIVKQLVDLHGGTITVRSGGSGHGTTFKVALPLSPLRAEADGEAARRHPLSATAAPAMPPEMRATIAGVKVLVVDDETDARELVRRLLEDCRAVVSTASSAAEALERIAAERPDVLVSDVGMPGEDGYSLLKRVRSLGAHRGGDVPAVALTAYARAEDRVRSVLAGFQMHISKPVEPAELIVTVASLAGRTPS